MHVADPSYYPYATPGTLPTPPKKSRTSLVVAIVSIVLLLCCCCVLASVVFLGVLSDQNGSGNNIPSYTHPKDEFNGQDF
jgi:flagellar basal body-associated protein FliL